MKTFALRLKPDADLKQSLKDFVNLHSLQAAVVLTAVGSLKQATLRFADRPSAEVLEQKFEIVSLSGTLCQNGVHLHIAISDHQGKTTGGHLEQGCIVYTTAEIVIGESKGFSFTRTLDPQTGYKELEISSQ